MNLVIDVGNTRAKMAVFQENAIVSVVVAQKEYLEKKVHELLTIHSDIARVIISNVSVANIDWYSVLGFEPVLLSAIDTRLPFENLYRTPDTLGDDRKALVAAAVAQYPQRNVLIIDAGTCITYDLKNSKNQYLGGAISPGLNMRLNALNSFTSKLPLVEVGTDVPLLGNTTTSSIKTGVVSGTTKEIKGFIQEYSEHFDRLLVIITGGDAQFLSINLKNGIFANSDFLLEGLNQILQFNTSQ